MGKNEWLKNLPMSGEKETHMKHMKILLVEKTNHPP
jgi:hypothetical protein